MSPTAKLDCRFFRSDQGNEPVRDWLRSLATEVKKEIGSDMARIEPDHIALARKRQKQVEKEERA